MKYDSDKILKAKVRDIVSPILAECSEAINPVELGGIIVAGLSADELADFNKYQSALLQRMFSREVEAQTRPPECPEPDLFPMESWISSAMTGKRIKYCKCVWRDHTAYRENQIKSMRGTSKSFEAHEQCREKLKSAGMADDPEMTTEDAVRRLGLPDAAE